MPAVCQVDRRSAPRDRRRCWASTSRAVTPNELIRALLRSPADLLWFGGIGTYVKADRPKANADVGDRANDALRVDARRAAAPA
ncbi:MAG: NAD-glutamate dehydrogenase domain-containing protein [Polymorphobacter sp.]|uniref:NAD-glutamate dehydrogenase domain-containing protein n=1 Tax=Polymorphobacter sp. TaxID=1909290 RepID=UPI003A855757